MYVARTKNGFVPRASSQMISLAYVSVNALVMSNVVKEAESYILIRGVDQS
jgi:hypothetical protein